ncbi:MAG TPA: protease inhibitor I42 family protein, partial [Dehalococcoidia bacterium]|nr:protease inhibitor I42 family protein [Dehalococcoidia bacterium]
VTLCSNPTTGYRWSEFAVISDPTVLEQVDHVYTPPEVENVVGAAGKDTWIFKELKKGMTNISLEYSQPWEGGEKGHWTFSFTVVAK